MASAESSSFHSRSLSVIDGDVPSPEQSRLPSRRVSPDQPGTDSQMGLSGFNRCLSYCGTFHFRNQLTVESFIFVTLAPSNKWPKANLPMPAHKSERIQRLS